MTDRYYALTVVLEKDVRDDDAEPILNAIRMIKGVQCVEGNVATPETYMAQERARMELDQRLLGVIFPHVDKKNKE